MQLKRLKFLSKIFNSGYDLRRSHYMNFPGGYGLEVTPDPFPNSVVKLKDAYDTAGATPWESRLPPGL